MNYDKWSRDCFAFIKPHELPDSSLVIQWLSGRHDLICS